jgi:hypothetical protein
MLKSRVTNCRGRVNISQLAGVHPASRQTDQIASPLSPSSPTSLVLLFISSHVIYREQKCDFVNCDIANF